ncbi:MAG: pilus assembly protein PilM [Planctomycetaceae bacterium]|nr:pilus assembly protein PilM [Planctomycetaceae bacterium]
MVKSGMVATLADSVSQSFHISRSLGYVGIDLGTYGLKIAQVRKNGQKLTLERAHCVPYRQPLDIAKRSLAIDVILESLDHAWSPTGRWFPDEAACLLPLPLMFLRTIDLPTTSSEDQQRMIESELSHDARQSAGPMIFECWNEGMGEARPTAASVLGASQGLVEELAESLYERGLACEVLDGHPHVLSRLTSLDRLGNPGGPIAVIDWGYESSLFVIARHGVPVYTRPLRDCGFRNVSEALCESLNLDAREVQYLLSSAQNSPEDSPLRREIQEMVFDLAATPLRRFEEELNRTLTFLRQQRTPVEPAMICLTGGGALTPGVVDWVTQSTGIMARLWEFPSVESSSPVQRIPVSLLSSAIALSSLRFES